LDTTLSVGELTSWLWNPMKAFVDRVLRARFDAYVLYEPTGSLTDLSPLDAATVGNAALRAGLCDEALDAYLAAAPEFPDGSWGRLERRRLARELEAFEAARQRFEAGHEMRSARIATRLGDAELSGRLGGLGPDRRVVLRFARTERKAELAAWIEHLLMQSVAEPRLPKETLLVLRATEARPSIVSFRGVANPRGVLAELIELYRTCREAPLPLLERASRVFAERFADGDRERAQNAARQEIARLRGWDSRIEYVLGPHDPFEDRRWAERFEQAALALYRPLLEHREQR
jgi:exonuclease V gamma subunit